MMCKINIDVDKLFNTLKKQKNLCITSNKKTYSKYKIELFSSDFFKKENLVKEIVNTSTLKIEHYFINQNLSTLIDNILYFIDSKNLYKSIKVIKFSNCIFKDLDEEKNKNHRVFDCKINNLLKFERCVFQSKVLIKK